MKELHLIVSPNAVEGFSDLQKAFDYIMADTECESAVLTVLKGVYNGQFYFDGHRKNGSVKLLMKGEGRGRTIIRGDMYAAMLFDKEKRGTFRTYTLFVSGHEVVLENMTIENTAGLDRPLGVGKEAGQALALYDDSESSFCCELELKSFQDTLFIAPLPEKERLSGGFNGPRRKTERKPSSHIYKDCCIEGTVDFIFGGGGALFEKCNIFVRAQKDCKVCYVAAPSCDKPAKEDVPLAAEKCGFVFFKCNIDGDTCAPVYLGRPWRPYGRCAYIECNMSDVITSAGWDNWGDVANETKCCFAEYNNFGSGSTGKRAFGTRLTEEKAYNLVNQFKQLPIYQKQQG